MFEKYQNFIFDLDDTLYSEKAYLYAGYGRIARFLEKKYQTDAVNTYNFLVNTFEKEGRSGLFDKLKSRFELKEVDLKHLLEILRTVQLTEKMRLYPASEKLLNYVLSLNKKVFILTNGNVIQQKNKIASINWGLLKERIKIYYADETARKPSPAGILKIISDNNLQSEETLMIGDSTTDEESARNASIDFVHIAEVHLIKWPD